MSKEHEDYIKKIKRDRIKVAIFRIAILVVFIALWEVAARLKWIDPFLTSSPTRIINSFLSFSNLNSTILFEFIFTKTI